MSRRLASHIIGIRDGCASTSSAETVHVDMRAMVDRFVSRINAPLATTGAPNDPPSSHRPLVVLTGATGSLGAHVLHHLLSSHPLVEIACLVRAETDALAFKRVEASLAARKTSGLCSLQLSSLRVHAAKLGEHNLGLATHLYAELNSRTKLIIHLAWAVNFVASLSSFESEHIASLANLAILARLTSATLVFGSSTASVLGRFMNPIQEAWPDDDASTAPNMGYAQSKWVAEKICERIEGVDVRIARIGQLCGDTREGIWNETEVRWACPLFQSITKS